MSLDFWLASSKRDNLKLKHKTFGWQTITQVEMLRDIPGRVRIKTSYEPHIPPPNQVNGRVNEFLSVGF